MTFHCSQTNKLEAVKKCASAVESRGVGQKPFALSTNVTKVSWNMQASTWREHIHKVPTCLRSEEALWSTHSFEQNQDLARIFCAALPPPQIEKDMAREQGTSESLLLLRLCWKKTLETSRKIRGILPGRHHWPFPTHPPIHQSTPPLQRPSLGPGWSILLASTYVAPTCPCAP